MKEKRFDSLDLKILNLLKKDARTPFVDIAKELNVRPGLVQTRYAKMKKAGLIVRATITLNKAKMVKRRAVGIGIEAMESDLEEVLNFIYSLKIEEGHIICWKTFGRYNLTAVISAKNLLDVHRIRHLIIQHPSVRKASMNIVSDMWYFPERLEIERLFQKK